MKTLHSLLLTSVFYALSVTPLFACTGGTNSGVLIPTPAYQTVAITDGEYYTLSVTCGETYHFDFCNNGGAAGSLFPEITILDATGTTELQFAAYAGGCSELTFISNFTGTIQVLVTDSGCFTSGNLFRNNGLQCNRIG